MSKITIPDNSILLLEGGSLRGLFTAGVLDTYMENDVYFGAAAPRRRCAAAACLA